MVSKSLTNLEKISLVANKLEYLLEKVVFVGGTVVELLVTDPAIRSIRPTVDVDTVLEIPSRSDYYELEEDLRKLGFSQRIGSHDPLCRWYISGITVDIMPDIPEILGFSNVWYKDAFRNSIQVKIDDEITIRVLSPPYFIATKLEAFNGRGNKDYLGSPDIEDIITILDGRESIVKEIRNSTDEVINYISEQLRKLLSDQDFILSIAGHLAPDQASQDRLPLVLERIKKIANA
jgi:predicted nucleotidyltransferase